MNKGRNIFDIKNIRSKEQEVFESIIDTKNILVERIVTLNHYDKPGKWYDQETDEWVLLLKGNAIIEIKDEEIITLNEGDYCFLPAHKIHRVKQTSEKSPCIWLAVHLKSQ
ncbi:MAG: cupin domain-containing protein [Bacteroidales bacterium]